MCWACNPLCGRCKPPQKRVVACPTCKDLGIYERAQAIGSDPVYCAKCGTDVTLEVHVEPVHCLQCDDWCAFPCKQFDTEPPEGRTDCSHRTPCPDRNE